MLAVRARHRRCPVTGAEAAVTVAIVLAVSLIGTALLVRGAIGEESDRDRTVREAQHDVGPDSLRLLEETDAHLDAYAVRLFDLYEQYGPPSAVADHTTTGGNQ